MNVGIYIYDQAEVLDFSGPFEVFSTASRVCADTDPFEVFLIAENAGVVTARAGYKVNADYDISNHPELDVLIVVGGVHDAEMQKRPVINWIAQQYKSVTIMASVCTGAFLLAQAQLLNGCKATTHWADLEEFKTLFPEVSTIENVRWVDEDKVITSAGISAGLDMSLHLVAKLTSAELASKTAKQMDYDWVSGSQ
jgi:transcriptional regulator GlxA family with amidase domain